MNKAWLVIIALAFVAIACSEPDEPIVHCNDECREKFAEVAEVKCPTHIQRMAKYDYEWTDGLGYKFTHATALGRGIVRYRGDKVKFQNGFGAWQHVNYSCDLDVNAETVVDYGVTAK